MFLRLLTLLATVFAAAATLCVVFHRKKPGPKRWYQKVGLAGVFTISSMLLSAVATWKASVEQEASTQRLETFSRPKAPRLQTFVADGPNEWPGKQIQVGAVIIPLSSSNAAREISFSFQNVGNAPVEDFETIIRFDSRLRFSHELKLSDSVSIRPPNLSPNESQMIWLQPKTIFAPSMAVLPLKFHETNVLDTPMNLNFFVNAKGMEPYPMLLTLLFTSGTGSVQTLSLPNHIATNGPFTFTLVGSETNRPNTVGPPKR